jgi:hypothetical protein
MSTVGKGVEEIRIRTDDAYRIFYVARFEEAVYVLHAFQKKTQKTSRSDIELGQQRFPFRNASRTIVWKDCLQVISSTSGRLRQRFQVEPLITMLTHAGMNVRVAIVAA